MSPPHQLPAKPSRVVGLVFFGTFVLVFLAALAGAIAVLVHEPRAAGWGLLAGFIAGIVLVRSLEFGFWLGLFLGILGLGAYAAIVFLGVSRSVAFWLFRGAIAWAFATLIALMSAGPVEDDW